jgi:hypothetical protein
MDRLYQDNSDSQRYFVMFLFYFADYNKDMVTFRKFLVSLYQRSNIEWQPIQHFVLFCFILLISINAPMDNLEKVTI